MSSPDGFSSEHLHLVISPSRLQLALHFLVHTLAAVVLWHNTFFTIYLKLALTTAITLSLYAVLKDSLDPRTRIQQVAYRDKGWMLGTRHNWQAAELCLPVFVGYWFIVLRFRTSGCTRAVVVGRDVTDPDVYRRLTVFLKFSRKAVVSG